MRRGRRAAAIGRARRRRLTRCASSVNRVTRLPPSPRGWESRRESRDGTVAWRAKNRKRYKREKKVQKQKRGTKERAVSTPPPWGWRRCRCGWAPTSGTLKWTTMRLTICCNRPRTASGSLRRGDGASPIAPSTWRAASAGEFTGCFGKRRDTVELQSSPSNSQSWYTCRFSLF